MKKISVRRGRFPALFGGFGFHNNEACLYRIINEEHFNQILCKNYREMCPGFMRTFAGYDDWTKEAMDNFAAYYEKMQKWTDTPMYFAAAKGKLHFSRSEMERYCEDVADNLEYLIREKNVRHIRYYCFSNEMSQAGWGELMKDLPLFKEYHTMLYRAFQNRKLNIGLLATDAAGYQNWNTVDWAIDNMSRITEDYCVHVYESEHDIYDLTFYDFFYQKCVGIVDKAIRNDGKRVILGEFGITKGGNLAYKRSVISDTCYYFDSGENAYSGLMYAEMIFAAVNAGIFALALWSYCDYPDPYSCAYSNRPGYSMEWGKAERFISGTTDVKYNKWGLTKWEDNEDYTARDFYWCIALICKYFKRNSKVLDIHADDARIRACGIVNRDGSVSLGFVNRNRHKTEIELDAGELIKKDLRVYVYDPQHVPRNKFCDLQPYSEVIAGGAVIKYALPPESVTILTTDYTQRAGCIYADGVRVDNGILKWNAAADETHCYYRVFAGTHRDFAPGYENQIASTIAEKLPGCAAELYYKVLSVDRSGNCF